MTVVQAKSTDCIFLLNTSSLVAHVAACCEPDDSACVVQVQDGDLMKAFRFACNVRRSALDGQIVPAEVFPSDYKLCMRPPCSKISTERVQKGVLCVLYLHICPPSHSFFFQFIGIHMVRSSSLSRWRICHGLTAPFPVGLFPAGHVTHVRLSQTE